MSQSSARKLSEEWLSILPEATTLEAVEKILRPIGDAAWITAAVADRIVDDVDVERAMLTLGLEKTAHAVEHSRKAMMYLGVPVEDEEDEIVAKTEEQLWHASLVAHFQSNPMDELLCHLRAVLLERLDRLSTYVEMLRQPSKAKEKTNEEDAEGWGWEDDGGDVNSIELPFSLSLFLQQSILKSALLLASNSHFAALKILYQRHAKVLGGQRLHILQTIPEHVPPIDFYELLPSIDSTMDRETPSPDLPWRKTPDWTETLECTSAFQTYQVVVSETQNVEHSAVEISQWYRERINKADNLGLVDVAFALVQHGASQGIPDLDELGEELGLLSRLVYDAPHSEEGYSGEDWTIARWRTLEPPAILKAYLAYSTSETIVNDIRHLAMPYLYVLEARVERAGRPDPDIVNRLFYEYIMQIPLDLVAAIFEASKPTLPLSERLIKKDEDMARLALACLYGSNELDSWRIMSQIFECLPAWNNVNEDENDEADMTLLSLGDFVMPSTSRPKCSPHELLHFFAPLPFSALSRMVDVLDIHLESGEILSRWNVPAPLRWFLQSANDEKQQRAWAVRMSRRAGNGGDEPESEEEWLELLDDMIKLGGREGALRGAFGLLSKEEVTKIFFSGLLSSGNFKVAKSLIRKARMPYLSDPQIIEEQVLTSSREFYDNATSGNLHQGDMKLAYDCLAVAKQSPIIQREREFIEATSRICSFNVMSRSGIPISPIEIRLAKDRLTLVARVLATTEDAYKHSSVILDLVHKLGYRDDITAEIKTLAMLADAALQAEDFGRAAETIERMVDRLRKLNTSEQLSEAREVCWHSCFQLGRQSEFHDVERKMTLLGYALELCPPEHVADVLNIWLKSEAEALPNRRDKIAALKRKGTSRKRSTPYSTTDAIRSRLNDLNLGAAGGLSATDAAAFAGRTLRNVAANFHFPMRAHADDSGRRGSENAIALDSSHQPNEVSVHAKQAFARGIGWLIGADEE